MADLSQNLSMENDELRSTEESEKMAELQNLIQQDLQLSSDIRPADNIKPAKKYSEIETVLLIGVTGMLGPYILRDLCARPKIKKIYCLMRKTQEEMLDRLRERLETTGVIEEVDFSKIICLEGDITLENLGMSIEEYEAISERIEAVIHLGIKADYTGEYSAGKDSLRTVNVIGTENILKFAVNKSLKCVFVASTLACAFTSLTSDRFSEDWQDPGTFDDVDFNSGYRISRFISEQLCKQALDFGVPVKVFRFGVFGGESKTGKCDYNLNQYSLALLTLLKLGYFPNITMYVPILPIDVYSKLSIKVFFNADAPPDVYNVCKSRFPSMKKLFEVSQELDLKLKLVSLRKFAGKVKKAENLPLDHFRFYFNRKESRLNEFLTRRVFKGVTKLLDERGFVFENFKMAKYVDIDNVDCTEASVKTDVGFLMGSGAFEKYGVN